MEQITKMHFFLTYNLYPFYYQKRLTIPFKKCLIIEFNILLLDIFFIDLTYLGYSPNTTDNKFIWWAFDRNYYFILIKYIFWAFDFSVVIYFSWFLFLVRYLFLFYVVLWSLSSSLPSEVLLKILSYLDAVSLLCSSCVNKRFYHLSNDK